MQDRAKELFTKGFHIQTEQKKGTKEFHKQHVDMKKGANNKRQRYSKRKQLVVGGILAALKEFEIKHPWTIKRNSFEKITKTINFLI